MFHALAGKVGLATALFAVLSQVQEQSGLDLASLDLASLVLSIALIWWCFSALHLLPGMPGPTQN